MATKALPPKLAEVLKTVVEGVNYVQNSALKHRIFSGGVNIMEVEENLKTFQKKLPLRKRQTKNNKFANFPLLEDCVSKNEDVSGIGDIYVPMELKQAISTHFAR